jgi:hypothetical protein
MLAGQLLAGCLGLGLVSPVRAEDAPRRVGSLNYISGEVSYVLRTEAGEPTGSDAENWLRADFDQPVCQDMSLRTGAMARARVRIGPDAIQMSDDTWLNVLNLTDQLIEASVRYGRIYLQLGKLEPGESVEIETPRGSLWLLQPGAYDVETGTGDEPTRIVVFEGKARFVGGAADLPIGAGKAVQITGNYPTVATAESDWAGINPAKPATAEPAAPTESAFATPPPSPTSTTAISPAEGSPSRAAATQTAAASPNPAPPAGDGQSAAPSDAAALVAADNRSPKTAETNQVTPVRAGGPPDKVNTARAGAGEKSSDEFLLWVEQSNEDQPQQTPDQSTRYVSAETTGADALDRYGRWDSLPDTEPVWFPTSVPGDWAPYRFGHWDWIGPWGWTWVDDQPWGFAPFHYGRWVNIDGRWGWVPGAIEAHPVYAPALVAFVDASDAPAGGPAAGPDGGPDVGWFPLGPGDDYTPWYQADAGYVDSVNAPEHARLHDFGAHGDGDRGHALWRAQYANRRFATVVPREALADARRIDREMVRRVDADRLGRAAVMRGAPRITPAVYRTPAEPGGFRGEPHGPMPAGAAAGGLHARPGGGPEGEHGPGMSGRAASAAAEHGGERPEVGHSMPGSRAAPGQYGRAEAAQGGTEGDRGAARQVGRPQLFQSSSAGYRGGVQQVGRSQATQGFHANGGELGRPQMSQGFRGGAQQFGQPQMSQGFRGGAQQFGRPQVFQAPAARAPGMMTRAAPQVAARPLVRPVAGGGGGAGARHK